MTFHDNEMNQVETRGSLLRSAADELEQAVDTQIVDEDITFVLAKDLLRDVVAARKKQQSTRE